MIMDGFTHFVWNAVRNYFEHCNGHLDSIRGGRFPEQLDTGQHHKMITVPQSNCSKFSSVPPDLGTLGHQSVILRFISWGYFHKIIFLSQVI
jgi:hypothetical protein